MAAIDIQPVILSGGAGTRLWPLSREDHPKPLLRLFGEHSLLQDTALRVDGRPPLVVCNEKHRFISAEQLREAGRAPLALILEPEGRNTAPALAVAALEAGRGGADPVMLVMPADHLIRKPQGFRDAVAAAAELAAKGDFVVFGVKPERAEIGYGYIRGTGEVEAFVEKPDAARAREFVASGKYSWNSGMFMLRVSCWQNALARLAPDIAAASEKAWSRAQRDGEFLRLERESFLACRAESIDKAVAERLAGGGAPRLRVVSLDAGWSDIGSWDALWEASVRDPRGNAAQGDVLLQDADQTLVLADGRLVAAVGTQDLLIIDTPDALLVAPKSRAADVKEVVAKLKVARRQEADAHRKVHRPWGHFDLLHAGPGFIVKSLVVKPGASLSLQSHRQRAEHWVVVRGTAQVTRGEDKFELKANESTYIPLGVRHRLENSGTVPLEIVEVQSGAYLGEDDIERFEDRYGRS
ncbi:MAG: mannose-phosphate guanylyltransferase / mannose-6-phosphate isomerase [Betaproteobacteria bacterium]|jgi:mannose-1-phosphate guanylyltransferase/mannose-6-phosphate isomerase|nr:mannose-phosphate guanylyltransferase / mannose-6-phosphate isomerase [Betaproteobacteria bacterium]